MYILLISFLGNGKGDGAEGGDSNSVRWDLFECFQMFESKGPPATVANKSRLQESLNRPPQNVGTTHADNYS